MEPTTINNILREIYEPIIRDMLEKAEMLDFRTPEQRQRDFLKKYTNQVTCTSLHTGYCSVCKAMV